jgi:penicillin-binding protein 2
MARDNRGLRLGALGVVAVLLMGALGVRLWFLQVVDSEAVAERFASVRTREVILPSERGRIFDADGRILADNERVLTVTIDQDVIRNRRTTREDLFRRLAGPLGYTSWLELELRFCGPTPDDKKTVGIDESNPNLPDKNCNGVFDPYLPFPAKEDVTEERVRFLLERRQDYPGVDVETGWRRQYLYAPLASQIVGYLGAVPADDKETLDRNELREYLDLGYRVNDKVGKAGIEQWFEKELRGTPGQVQFEIDASGNVLRELSRTEPVPGQDIQLTIDLDVQQYAEQALETQIKNRRSDNPYCKKRFDGTIDLKCYGSRYNYKAPAGSVVVEHHASGQIIAMASYPTFDNRWFGIGATSEKFAQLFPQDTDKDPDTNPSPLINRAIQGRYNVGSTFKPFTAFAAMNTGFIPDPVNYRFEDQGSYTIPEEFCNPEEVSKCTFRNAWNYALDSPNRYGSLTLPQSLAVSSDAFYYRIGAELFLTYRSVAPVLQNQYKLFGFGEKSGIELPYEYKGIVPDKDVKKRLAEQNAISDKEGQGFYVGDALLMAIGQGLNAVTPLQLTNGYATIANGGYLMKPQIVKAIFEPGVPDSEILGAADIAAGVVAVPYGPVVRSSVGATAPENLLLITSGLQQALSCQPINGKTATGCNAFRGFPLNDLQLAGKTGTAQGRDNLPEFDSSAFVAYDSGNLDGYTIGAYLEKGGFGGAGAAPLVKCMFLAVTGRLDATLMEPVTLSDPLNVSQPTAAKPQFLPNGNTCLDVQQDNSSRER